MSKLIFTIFFISLSYLNAITITKSKDFTIEYKPELKKTSFEVNIKHTNQNIIEKKIKSISANVKSSGICTGGQYTINPSYIWKDNQKIDDGYFSRIIYDCEFVNKKVYESLLDEVKAVTGIKLVQQKIYFVQTEKEKEKQTQELEKLAFEFAKSYIKNLNSSFNSCEIESIDLHNNYSTFNSNQNIVKHMQKLEVETSSIVTTPLDDKVKNSINVKYKFICK